MNWDIRNVARITSTLGLLH